MEKEYKKAEEQNADALAQRVEQAIPDTRISNLGWLVLVRLPNQGVFTLTPISNTMCDLNGTDCQDKKYEFQSITWERAIAFLQAVAGLREQSSAGAVEPVKKPIQEIDRLRHTQGEDPLGRLAMNDNPNKKKNSEGKRKSAIGHNFENGSPLSLGESTADNQTLSYLAEMLPADNATIGNGELTVEIDAAKIVITSQANGNFSVRSFVNGEATQESENLTAGELVKWSFEICGKLQSRIAERDTKDADVDTSDVWSVIKELSKEAGHSDDILRNKDLFDLKQGLTVARPPFDRSQSPDSFVGNVTESIIRGGTWHNGHPVRLCENDASKPFGNGLNGKKLVYTLNEGATLVDADKLPPKQKLNYDPVHGVILTDENIPTQRPSWKFSGWK